MTLVVMLQAHSCVDDSTDKRFLSKRQLLMINQLQDVLTRRSLSTAYRSPHVSCLLPHPHVLGRLGLDTVDKDLDSDSGSGTGVGDEADVG